MGEFEEPLCGCLQDLCSCCIAFVVPGGVCWLQASALGTATSRETGGGTGVCVPFLCVCCFGALGGAWNRGQLRRQFSIRGSFLADCCIWLFCGFCAATQEYREVKNRTMAKS